MSVGFGLGRRSGIVVALFASVVGVAVTGSLSGAATTSPTVTSPTAKTPLATSSRVVLPAGCVTAVAPKTHKPIYKSPPPLTINVAKTYVAHVSTTCGTFDITLAPKVAPKTANSFVFLARHHFYDGLTFFRLFKNFVIQGGDPKGNGTGGPGYVLPTEPPKTGYMKGSVGMANAGPDTTGSQFFVAVSATGAKDLGGPPYLYSDLGTITKNFGVIPKLMTFAPASNDGQPTRPLYIFKITITES
ncbi:MAG: peptidylprolyl isomerase [Acidimicrobiia bacterium]